MTDRQRALIALLMRAQGFVTVETIAESLNVSKRTIHNDLNAIIGTPDNPYMIEKRQGKGIRLSQRGSSEDSSLSEADQRLSSIICRLLLEQETLTIAQLSAQLYVSATSISADLAHIRQDFLDPYGIKLISDQRGTRIEASEAKIQKGLLQWVRWLNRHSTSTDPEASGRNLIPYFGQNIIDACLDVMASLKQYDLEYFAPHYETNVFYILVIMSIRIMQGHHLDIERTALRLDEVMALQRYLIAKDLMAWIGQRLNIQALPGDLYMLSVYLQANRLEFAASTFYVRKESTNIAETLIERMSKCLDVPLGQDERLRKNLAMHLDHMIYRIRQDIDIENPLLEQIKDEFRLMFDLTWLIVEETLSSKGLSVSEDEVGFMVLYFQSALDRLERSRKLLIVCPNGVVGSGFIRNRVRKVLPPLDVIETVSLKEAQKYDLSAIDLVISTVPLEAIDRPVVYVTPLVTEKDLEAINKFYQERLLLPQEDGPVRLMHLRPYLDPQFLFFDQEATHRETIITTVGQKLLELGVVKDGYTESLFAREANGGTEIASGAAVPHGSTELVQRTMISVWINRTPVRWGKYAVRMVVFMTLAADDLEKARWILGDIFRIIRDKKTIDQMVNQESKEELYLILSGGKTLD